MADLVIFMGCSFFSDLNEVRFLLAQLLCQQTRIRLTCLSKVVYLTMSGVGAGTKFRTFK